MDMLMTYGDAIKATPDGRVSGYLVRFGSPRDTDLEGDYFTKSTDFGRPMASGESFPLRLYYAHGMDPKVGRKAIGNGVVKMTDAGLWYEGQIEQSDEYRAMIKRLAQEGRLGFSSGAAGHLVIREATGVGKSATIVAWPLGEASLTPRPAEARNMATVKSLGDYMMPDMTEMPGGESEVEDDMPIDPAMVFAGWESDAAETLVCNITGRLMEALSDMVELGQTPAEIDDLLTRYHAIVMQIAAMPGAAKSFRRSTGRPTTIKQFERQLRDALSLSRREAASIASKSWPILRDAENGDEPETTADGPEVAANNDDQTRLRSALLRRLIAQRIAVQTAVEV